MDLIRCPACRGTTPVAADAAGVACHWCRQRVEVTADTVVRDAAAVRAHTLTELKPVADLLLTFGIGQLVTAAFYFLFFLVCGGALSRLGDTPQTVLVVAVGVVLEVGGVFIVAAAVGMRRGRWRLIAVTGAVFAAFSPLLLGLPVGVWALTLLSRPEVRAAFRREGGCDGEPAT